MTPLFARCKRNNESEKKKERKELTSIIHQPKIVSITARINLWKLLRFNPMPVCSHYTKKKKKKKEKPPTFAGRHKNVYYKSNDQRSGNPTYPSVSKDTSSKQHRDIRNKQHGNPIQVPLNAWYYLRWCQWLLDSSIVRVLRHPQPMGATSVARVSLGSLCAPINGRKQRVVPPRCNALTANANGDCLDQRLSIFAREKLCPVVTDATDSTRRFYFQTNRRWLRVRDRSFASIRTCFGQFARTQTIYSTVTSNEQPILTISLFTIREFSSCKIS